MTKRHRHTDWTIETYAAHNEALRDAEQRFQGERDRRYAEVKSAEERALRVKEQADRDALGLAREIQAYKDMKANELREQISSERHLYVTHGDLDAHSAKIDAVIDGLKESVTAHHAAGRGMRDMWGWMVAAVAMVLALLEHMKVI